MRRIEINDLRKKKTQLLLCFATLFVLFQLFKIKSNPDELDLLKGKIVFSSPGNDGSEIYSMSTNGRNLKQLTKNSITKTNPVVNSDPSFSPDGKLIVFISTDKKMNDYKLINDKGQAIGEASWGGSSDVFVMDCNGKNLVQLTHAGINSSPSFLPKTYKIIFNSQSPQAVKMIEINSGRQIIINSGAGKTKFSSDELWKFDNFDCDISVEDEEGGRRRLTHFNDSREVKLGIDFDISPDNKRLVIITSETRKFFDGANRDFNFYDIYSFYLSNIDGSCLEEIHRIDGTELKFPYTCEDMNSKRTGTIRQCKFSPDGQNLIFNAYFQKEGIYRLNLIDKTVKNITINKEAWNKIIDFALTPDGKRIVFVADIIPNYYFHNVIIQNIKNFYCLLRQKSIPRDNKYICIMDLNGNNFRKLAKLPPGSELGNDFICWEK